MLRFWLGWSVPEEGQVVRSVMDLLMYRGSCVYRFEAEVVDNLVKTWALGFATQGAAWDSGYKLVSRPLRFTLLK